MRNPKSLTSTRLESPIGTVYSLVTDRGACGLFFSKFDHESALARMVDSHSLKPLSRSPLASSLNAELRAYFSGRAVTFKTPLDPLEGTDFQRRVWAALARIPRGECRSYAWVGRRIGKDRAARAIGGAVGANPIPILIPCHRVIASDGSIGGYSGGLSLKRRLLSIEGVRVD
jgi:methylated-DNA-[protein]-cysteine S-methyltransferase